MRRMWTSKYGKWGSEWQGRRRGPLYIVLLYIYVKGAESLSWTRHTHIELSSSSSSSSPSSSSSSSSIYSAAVHICKGGWEPLLDPPYTHWAVIIIVLIIFTITVVFFINNMIPIDSQHNVCVVIILDNGMRGLIHRVRIPGAIINTTIMHYMKMIKGVCECKIYKLASKLCCWNFNTFLTPINELEMIFWQSSFTV